MLDYLIKKGIIIDGSGNKRYVGNIGIQNGRIKFVGNMEEEAKEIIQGDGFIVAPGFVDYHSHSDISLLNKPNFNKILEQGITTEITGMCGLSLAPASIDSVVYNTVMPIEKSISKAEKIVEKLDRFDKFMNYFENRKLGSNMAFYVGFGNLRCAVMGHDNRKPSDDELNEMKNHLKIAMEAGAIGLTTGLCYAPQVFAKKEEVIELCKVLKEYGGSYNTHIRNQSVNIIDAINEAIDIGEQSGIPVHISHIQISGRKNWDLDEEILEIIYQAIERGMDITADLYPYEASATNVLSALPPKYRTDGGNMLLENLHDKNFRNKVRADVFNENSGFENYIMNAGIENITIVNSLNPALCGKSIVDIAKKRNKDLFDTLMDIVIEDKGKTFCAFFSQNTSVIEKFFANNFVMGGTDSAAFAEGITLMHPRSAGTFPTLISKFIRDKNMFSLEEGIRKLTYFPSLTAKLYNKGLLKEGYDADLVIFDYDKIEAKANFVNPLDINIGIKYVLVNGKVVVKDGVANGIEAGTTLKKGV